MRQNRWSGRSASLGAQRRPVSATSPKVMSEHDPVSVTIVSGWVPASWSWSTSSRYSESRGVPATTIAPRPLYRSVLTAAARRAAGLADEAGAGRAHADPAGRAEGCVDRGHPRRERELAPWRGRANGRCRRCRARGGRPVAVGLLHPLGRGPDPQRLPGLDVEVVDGQAAGDVVDQALGDADVRVVSDAVGLEDDVRELRHVYLEWDAVLQAEADRDREGVHHAREGRALLRHLHEDLAEPVVGVGAGGQVALDVADPERGRPGGARPRQPPPDRCALDLDDRAGVGDDPPVPPAGARQWTWPALAGCAPAGCAFARLGRLGRRQRLPDLAVVPVDRERLEPELPTLVVGVLDFFDFNRFRKINRLADGTRDERLHRRHHPDVAHVVDGRVAHGAVEDRVVLLAQRWRALHGVVLGDVLEDRLDVLLGVTQPAQRPRHGLVDDRHGPATDQLLRLDQGEVRLDPGGVAVHEQAYGPGRGDHRSLGVSEAVLLTEPERLVPGGPGRFEQARLDQAGVDVVDRPAVPADDPQHRLPVLAVAGERPHDLGDASAGPDRKSVV